MLHKAASSFSPFKLQHLHHHVRSALNLNLGSNASATATSSSSGASANALGGSASQASGAGGAKWSAGRSYSYQAFGRSGGAVPANASASGDASSSGKGLDDDQAEEAATAALALAKFKSERPSLSWRHGRSFAGRRRSSSLSNPGLTTGLPLPSSSSEQSLATASSTATPSTTPNILPRSSPYSFNHAQLQARYRHAFSQAAATSKSRLLLNPSHQKQQQRQPQLLIASFASNPSKQIHTQSAIASTATATKLPYLSKHRAGTAPSSPVLRPAQLQQQVRRNSTSVAEGSQASSASLDGLIDAASTATPASNPQSSATAGDAQATSTADFPTLADTKAQSAEASENESKGTVSQQSSTPQQKRANPESIGHIVQFCVSNQEISRIRAFIRTYKASELAKQSLYNHETLIRALNQLVPFGITTDEIVDLYQDMLRKDFLPGAEIQSIVTVALCKRSSDTMQLYHRQQLQNNAATLAPAAQKWVNGEMSESSNTSSETTAPDAMHSQSSLAALQQQSDEDFQSAANIFKSMGSAAENMSKKALGSLLAGASARGNVDIGLETFALLEGNPRGSSRQKRATPEDFKNLLLTYCKAGEYQGLDVVFKGFLKGIGRSEMRQKRRRQSAADLVAAKESEDVLPQLVGSNGEDSDVQVWSAMIYAKLIQKEGAAALELLENMLATEGDVSPDPTATTLLSLIKGFAESGDLESAFRWAAKFHATPRPYDLPVPPSIEETMNAIISASSDAQALQQAAGPHQSILQSLGQQVQALTGGLSSSASGPGSFSSPKSPASSSFSGSNDSATSRDSLASAFTSASSIPPQTLPIQPPAFARKVGEQQQQEVPVTIDFAHSSMIDDLTRSKPNAIEVFGLVMSSARRGIHAHPETLARLTDKLAKQGAPKELEQVYLMAYNNIASLPSTQDQAAAWAYLEDRMLIAMALLGDLNKAAMHRDRILKAGAAPSADAYAAMITSAKDTTDDATVALEMFEESRRFGVTPNLYLFNILISKLSKARRTHLALSYFEQMKAMGIRPSAVSYGSVIAACCRTGDERAATFLFDEMTRVPGFRPRVPPYNTMMQFYIATQPNREKALSYFDAMLRARVAPTGHTYKLLLDAYGSIQDGSPVDLASVNDVFGRLVEDPHVPVTGVHWASLMNAHGIGLKDVDAAVEVFDSIAAHPSSQNSKTALPDVICYEALFNIFLANDRKDLIEKYLEKMQAQYVRPTAYIYNTLIRAHGVNDIAKARELFESLSDAPSGVAAPGNHANDAASTSDNDASEATASKSTGATAVYREPSTYEAMIRCEIAAGETGRAEELLQLAIKRAFPAAVIARLSKLIEGKELAGPLFASSTATGV